MEYEFLEHTADVKFKAFGSTLEEVFISSFKALRETICGKIKILEQEKKQIEVEGKDIESLLYNFLEEFLFLLDSEDFLVSKIVGLKIDEDSFVLKAEVVGDRARNYKFTNDVKAVTYSDMFVREEKGKFICQVVLDV